MILIGKIELSDEDMKLIEADRKLFGLTQSEVLTVRVAEAYCGGNDGSSVMLELVRADEKCKVYEGHIIEACLGVIEDDPVINDILDEEVCDLKSIEATEINNSGKEVQLRYIINRAGMSHFKDLVGGIYGT